MKTLRSNVLTMVLSLVAGAVMAAPTQDFEKKIVKQYAISSDGEVEIMNRYGKVQVETWDQNEVKIEVTILVEAKNQDKANDVFERVDINFSNTSSLVRASTDISSGSSWNKWFGKSAGKFEVNYHIWLPSTVDVDLENKYGDIVVASLDGDVQIDLKYGNLRVGDIAGDVSVDLGYGKGSVTSGGNADFNLQYCTFHGGDFGDVNSSTKYSTVELGNVGVLQTNTSYDGYRIASATAVSNVGKYDDFAVEKAESVTMSTKYTNLEIGLLSNEADLNFTNGGVTIKDLASGFSKVKLNGDYTNLVITTSPSTEFHFEVTGRYTTIKHSDVEVYHDVQTNNTNKEIRGYRGSSKEAGGAIIAKMSYGNVRIK